MTVKVPTREVDPAERALAHKLLIELLSYQFAFPVRWIETQNEILAEENEVQRVVEIGPSKVLSGMANKTAKRKFGLQDKLQSRVRRILAYSDDVKDIQYEYEEPVAPESTEDKEPSAKQESAPKSATAPPRDVPAPVSAPPAPAQVASKVADVPLPAHIVVLSIVSQKLKRAFSDVPLSKTIRELSGGKSTLQNELIGDLGAEFGNLPDGSEDLPLEELGAAIESGSFSGKPGKTMAALISKLISSRMPGGFNQATARSHLEAHWGLDLGRQTAVLCLATSMDPGARLGDSAAANEFLNSVVLKYGGFASVTLTPGGTGASSASAAGSGGTTVDAASLEAANKEHKKILMKQYQVLADYLEMGNESTEEELAEAKSFAVELEGKLDRWSQEFDEAFFDGIKPSFDAKKAREFDSWWNWVREDLFMLLQEIYQNRNPNLSSMSPRFQALLNRWTPSCSEMVKAKISKVRESEPHLEPLFRTLLSAGFKAQAKPPVYRYGHLTLGPRTTVSLKGAISYDEVARDNIDSYAELVSRIHSIGGEKHPEPFVNLRRSVNDEWFYDASMTSKFHTQLKQGITTGLNFTDLTILVTGAGPNSIGASVIEGLLSGGAKVFLTTSRPPSATADYYQNLYRQYGARGSKLVVLPFNQGSRKDCENLIQHIYDTSDNSAPTDLDYIVPFAAVPENGRQLDGLDSKSELAHRIMLVNLFRLLGHVKTQKQQLGFNNRPTNVILPLSPNHGTFGGDGLYGESKIGLETLFNRFRSENWSSYLTICGAVIGWTRGTGLMAANNLVAESVESEGALTFSQSEMAFNILALMTPEITAICEDEPVYADLNGGLQHVDNLKNKITVARKAILQKSEILKALVAERHAEQSALYGHTKEPQAEIVHNKRSNLTVGYTSLPSYTEATSGLQDLQGMVDLTRTCVVVGFSDLSPLGSARTRWEMETVGDLTQEGYNELAWIMGLVEHFDGNIKGQPYVGWVDKKTKEPVADHEIPKKYGEEVKNHIGIRFIEPEGLDGYDPKKKELLQEVAVEEDLPEFEASQASAEAFKLRHGDKVSISKLPDSDDYRVRIKKGAHFLVPKAVEFDRLVAGQLPKGWDPVRYGIPEDIVQQVDPITIYMLCCVCEAFHSAGIKDPLELYHHLHVTELVNCLGTGVGGLVSMRGIYRDRYLERPVQSDVLQESYLNALGAWTNMLILASAGPIKSPVGTCATAIESLDAGCEAIQAGKAKVALVGGSDDFQEEMSYEFANMKATASAREELAKGRLPREMSRPTATTRAGFVESAGCGAQIVTSAALALEMGLPIYGIVAYTQMAGDKIGRSVPAPGQGVLSAARESPEAKFSPLLDLSYRRECLRESIKDIERWREVQSAKLAGKEHHKAELLDSLESSAMARIRDAQYLWGNNFRSQAPGIAPMRASLAVWGLEVDDIQVASLHGTSTVANDKNESNVINQQMEHLGRTKGNPLTCIAQKYITGHPKGAAGAWMLNGVLQSMNTGLIPGNRNADNVDEYLRRYEHLLYPTVTLEVDRIKAAMLTSFGFGQKGGVLLMVNRDFLFTAISKEVYENYRSRALKRMRKGNAAFVRGVISNSLFKAKTENPWANTGEAPVFLNPKARVKAGDTGNLYFEKDDLVPRYESDKVLEAFMLSPPKDIP